MWGKVVKSFEECGSGLQRKCAREVDGNCAENVNEDCADSSFTLSPRIYSGVAIGCVILSEVQRSRRIQWNCAEMQYEIASNIASSTPPLFSMSLRTLFRSHHFFKSSFWRRRRKNPVTFLYIVIPLRGMTLVAESPLLTSFSRRRESIENKHCP